MRPNGPRSMPSIPTKAARRFDLGESIEIEIDDRLKRRRGGTVAEALGQGIEPCGTFGLDREHFGEGVVPALGPAPAVHRLAAFDHNPWLGCLQPGAMASLALGVAQGVFALRFTASGHGSVLRYVTYYNGPHGQLGPRMGTAVGIFGGHFWDCSFPWQVSSSGDAVNS